MERAMIDDLNDSLKETSYAGLSRTFHRLGWCGFWTQVVVGAIPSVLMTYLFFFAGSPTGPRAGFRFVEFLTLASLAVLLFTTIWSFRYTRLAKRITTPEYRPTNDFLSRTAWTGIVASTVGVLISIVVMLVEVAHLLFYFLSVPQAGVPVIQTTNENSSWVSAVDMLSLMALTMTLFAEVIILVFSLWLLFRVTIVSSKSYEESPT
jgi:hypothetical protein